MDEARRTDLVLARDYARLVERGHAGFLAETARSTLARLAGGAGGGAAEGGWVAWAAVSASGVDPCYCVFA